MSKASGLFKAAQSFVDSETSRGHLDHLVTLTDQKTVQIGIVGTLAVHALLFLALAWLLGINAAARFLQQAVEEEKQVTLLFPDQVLEVVQPPPPEPAKPEPPKPKPYIRTTQNAAAASAPVKADFVSDRNTVAAAEKAASPDGTEPLPTQDGMERKTLELMNRDQRDGETRDDNASAIMRPPPPPPAPPPQMRPPSADALPPGPLVARAEPNTAAAKMIEELESAGEERLPIEVKKPAAPEDRPPTATPPSQPAPDQPPTVAKAIPVDPATMKPMPKAQPDAFSPFTRTSKVKGTINNRGQAAVNAAETPMGKYMRSVTAAVEKKWHLYRRQNADAVTFGNLKLRFFVTRTGKPEAFEVLSAPTEADPRMADFTLRAIRDAEIPPIPADLLPMLEQERVEIEYDVLIY